MLRVNMSYITEESSAARSGLTQPLTESAVSPLDLGGVVAMLHRCSLHHERRTSKAIGGLERF